MCWKTSSSSIYMDPSGNSPINTNIPPITNPIAGATIDMSRPLKDFALPQDL